MEQVGLLETETVEQAGRNMARAVERMSFATNKITEAVRRLEAMMDRLEALKLDVQGRGRQVMEPEGQASPPPATGVTEPQAKVTERDRAMFWTLQNEQYAKGPAILAQYRADACAEAVEAQTKATCWTCGGQRHVSGKVCVCGGTNRHSDEVRNLRLAVFDAEAAVSRLREIKAAADLLMDVLAEAAEASERINFGVGCDLVAAYRRACEEASDAQP